MEGTLTLATLITQLTSVWTMIFTNIGQVLTTAVSSPIVILFIGMSVAGCIVGFGKKLLHV